jgi:hypothetical protein
VCFAFLQRSSCTSVCSLFFDRASSKSQFNIIASLRPSMTKASTQNLQNHSGNLDHYHCGELILRLLVAFGLWVFVLRHSSALLSMCHWFYVMLYLVVRSLWPRGLKSVVRDKVLRWGALAQRVEVRCTWQSPPTRGVGPEGRSPLYVTKSSDEGRGLRGSKSVVRDKVLRRGAWS